MHAGLSAVLVRGHEPHVAHGAARGVVARTRRLRAEQRVERVVEPVQDAARTAEVDAQLRLANRALAQPLTDLVVHGDVGAAEAVDALLGIADDGELAGGQGQLVEPARTRAVLAQVEHDLRLQGVGVLELVDQQVIEARLIERASVEVALEQLAQGEQEVDLVEHGVRPLDLLVAAEDQRAHAYQPLRQPAHQRSHDVGGERPVGALLPTRAATARAISQPAKGGPALAVVGEVALLELAHRVELPLPRDRTAQRLREVCTNADLEPVPAEPPQGAQAGARHGEILDRARHLVGMAAQRGEVGLARGRRPDGAVAGLDHPRDQRVQAEPRVELLVLRAQPQAAASRAAGLGRLGGERGHVSVHVRPERAALGASRSVRKVSST